MKIFKLSLLLLLFPYISLAQGAFPFFKITEKLPDDLLSKRSVVFMNVKSLEWDIEAEKIHKAFVKTGVDAVAYYALSDILSGHDATNSFYKDISERSIENLLIIHQTATGFELYATKLPAENGFFVEGMLAFQIAAPDLESLGKNIITIMEQSDLERANFLIIDSPETFKQTNVIKSRRVENYNPDIRIDKVAIPKFKSKITTAMDVDQANNELDSIMAVHYPFRYGLVEADATDEEMIAQGYLMVMRKLENNGESLKRMLGYKAKDETLLITVRKGEVQKIVKYQVSEFLHKYYVQQLYTKDIYLGNYWDADKSWQQALINHVENLAVQLERK